MKQLGCDAVSVGPVVMIAQHAHRRNGKATLKLTEKRHKLGL